MRNCLALAALAVAAVRRLVSLLDKGGPRILTTSYYMHQEKL